VGSWTEVDERIVIGNRGMTDRAARWACEQVGRHGRSVAEVAADLGCDWHTVNRP
jgi:transposase